MNKRALAILKAYAPAYQWIDQISIDSKHTAPTELEVRINLNQLGNKGVWIRLSAENLSLTDKQLWERYFSHAVHVLNNMVEHACAVRMPVTS